MKRSLLLVLSLLACLSLLLSGCGGAGSESSDSSSARTAAATFTIVWPEASKLIPIASRAIQVDVLQGTTKVASKTAARGAAGSTTTIKIQNIPAGNLTFTATALPNVNTSGSVTTGSGVPQAIGSAPLKTEAGKTAKITLTMATTIVRLAIFPNPWQIQKLTPTVPARATAYDAQNRIVMTDVDEQFTWTSANTDVVTISPASGAIEGLTVGTTTITVKDKESGKTATSTVEVVEALPVDRVLLSPATLNLSPRATGMLTAQALDEEDEDLEYTADKFSWTSSDPTKATVDATGKVTAVANGTTSIEAKEKVTGKAATAQVTVETADLGDLVIRRRITGEGSFTFGRLRSINTLEPFDPPRGDGFNQVSRLGERTLYTVNEGGPTGLKLYSEKIDGSEKRLVASIHPDDRYTYRSNADGTKVLLCVASNEERQSPTLRLEVINIVTGAVTPQPAPNFPSEAIELRAWSPSGDRAVFTSVTRASNGHGTYHMYLVNTAGSVIREFPSQTGNDTNQFHFNYTGDKLVYTETTSADRKIVVVDKDGRPISEPRFSDDVTLVKFHPTRDTLVYVGIKVSTGRFTIYDMEVSGSNLRPIYVDTTGDLAPTLLWDFYFPD